MKLNQSPSITPISINPFGVDTNEQKNNKFVKQIVRRSSCLISGKNLITNIITHKIENNIGKSSPKHQNTVLDEYLSFRAKENESSNVPTVRSGGSESKYSKNRNNILLTFCLLNFLLSKQVKVD